MFHNYRIIMSSCTLLKFKYNFMASRIKSPSMVNHQIRTSLKFYVNFWSTNSRFHPFITKELERFVPLAFQQELLIRFLIFLYCLVFQVILSTPRIFICCCLPLSMFHKVHPPSPTPFFKNICCQVLSQRPKLSTDMT